MSETYDCRVSALKRAIPHIPTRVEFVVEQLLHLIQSQQLRPGDRLDEKSLAAQFGVSRTPIREAFSHLIATGHIARQAHKGCRVSETLR